MKTIILTLVLISGLVVNAAAQTNMASVDMNQVAARYWKSASEQQALQAAQAQVRQRLATIEQEGQSLVNEAREAQEGLDNPAFNQSRRDELQNRIEELQGEIQEKRIEANREQVRFERTRQETEQRILNDIKAAVRRIANSKGIDIVLDAAVVPFAKTDLTEEVVTELNKNAPES
jgi:Skp family chaperone for outer membrane proteins